MIEALRNALRMPDLRKKILFTLGILVVYRFAAHVPVPGVDREALRFAFSGVSGAGQVLNFLNLLSGGALSQFSVMALGVYPYITAQIVIQLLTPLIPRLQALAREGEAGRHKTTLYTYLLTIPLALLQGVAQAALMMQYGVLNQFGLGASTLVSLSILASLVAGTMLAIWLGELISQEGIGNGISIIILGGIVAQVPANVARLVLGDVSGLIMFLIVTIITVGVIVVVQEGERRIPVQYGRRVVAMRGNRLRVAGGQATHVPLKVNSAGMIPLIFAQAILIFPSAIASYLAVSGSKFVSDLGTFVSQNLGPNGNMYWITYFLMVVAFTYFYTDVMFRQQNLAEMLQRQGGFIPGIRPGRRTEEYLNGVVQRITLVGALFLGTVAVLPWLVRGIAETNTMLITSAGLLIVVGVVLDTMRQLEAQLLMRRYEGFLRR
ncbi:MAG: preprotein translocase subunit SecY [Anaerolineae bacterium]|nr:preprotein translocase subunit SecY [Anaerolineae bacterium]